MLHNLKRVFGRAVKRLSGQPLTLDDISVIKAQTEPGYVRPYRARRQYDSDYWKVYTTGSLALPTEWCPHTLEAGLTVQQAMEKLEALEKPYQAKLRGKTGVAYNHFSKVRAMLETEAAAIIPEDVSTAVDTQQAVAIKGPLKLKKPASTP